jgi:hypothetical protein
MKVYLSSPRASSQTFSAKPKSDSSNYSKELTACPPQANVSLSIFLLFALLTAKIPFLANSVRESGSIPF